MEAADLVEKLINALSDERPVFGRGSAMFGKYSRDEQKANLSSVAELPADYVKEIADGRYFGWYDTKTGNVLVADYVIENGEKRKVRPEEKRGTYYHELAHKYVGGDEKEANKLAKSLAAVKGDYEALEFLENKEIQNPKYFMRSGYGLDSLHQADKPEQASKPKNPLIFGGFEDKGYFDPFCHIPVPVEDFGKGDVYAGPFWALLAAIFGKEDGYTMFGRQQHTGCERAESRIGVPRINLIPRPPKKPEEVAKKD